MTMKKADYEKERKFIEHYAVTGKASESCVLAGYKKENSAQMGYYLKSKLSKDILQAQRDVALSLTGGAISKLKSLLESESDNVVLNACKLILDINGFNSQEVNVNLNNKADKSDEELISELKSLLSDDDIRKLNA